MLHYLDKMFNGTGGNFVDILINVAPFLQSSYLSFLKAQNIAGFEFPHRIRFSERLGSAFWRLFLLIRRAYFVIA